MCNRARNRAEPEAESWFGDGWLTERPRDNRFNPIELAPRGRVYVVREKGGRRGIDVMAWDVLGGNAPWPMTNVRNLALPQWRALAENPANRCLVPLTEFCEWTPKLRRWFFCHRWNDALEVVASHLRCSVCGGSCLPCPGYLNRLAEEHHAFRLLEPDCGMKSVAFPVLDVGI